MSTDCASIDFELAVGHANAYLLAVRTNGHFERGFAYLQRTAAFESEASRREWASMLNAMPGIDIQPEQLDKYPTFPLRVRATAEAYDDFERALDRAAARRRA